MCVYKGKSVHTKIPRITFPVVVELYFTFCNVTLQITTVRLNCKRNIFSKAEWRVEGKNHRQKHNIRATTYTIHLQLIHRLLLVYRCCCCCCYCQSLDVYSHYCTLRRAKLKYKNRKCGTFATFKEQQNFHWCMYFDILCFGVSVCLCI